jgi:capsular polysaccharide biosynthesis protein
VDREITLGDIGRSLWRGRWIIVATTLIAALAGLLLTFVTSTTYTATARVFLGQATTTSGAPISTPGTNPFTAPTALKSDDVLSKVADEAGVSVDRVRSAVSITVPRAPGASAAGQPAVATITVQDSDRPTAQKIANAYAEVVLVESNRGYRVVQEVYRARLARLKQDEARYEREVRTFSRLLLTSAGTPQADAYQTLLFASQQQLSEVRGEIDSQELTLAKSEQAEAPQVISLSEEPTSSTSAPNRLRTTIIAGLIGLLVGIIIALVWKGGAGRKREADTA